jgi:enterobactin synthetase component F
VAAESQAGKRIVAYVVLHEGRSAGAAALRRWVGLRLPDYMVPSGIVRLDFLPLTPSGKLDRAALPPPEEGLGGRETHVEPSNSTERRLAALWREHLGTSRVGLFDNFFELGGDSLLAAGIVERIRSDFKISLPTGVIWERPTLAQLAAAVAEEPRETAQPIGRAERRPIL